jgi:hypothetical protein
MKEGAQVRIRRDESTFYEYNTTNFLENVSDGLDRDRVAVELRSISFRAARAALESLPNRIRR